MLAVAHTIERKCYVAQTITEPQFRKLAANIKEFNFYSNYLADTYNLEITAKPLPLPSQLNDFTRPAYLSLLKDKHDLINRGTTTNTEDS